MLHFFITSVAFFSSTALVFFSNFLIFIEFFGFFSSKLLVFHQIFWFFSSNLLVFNQIFWFFLIKFFGFSSNLLHFFIKSFGFSWNLLVISVFYVNSNQRGYQGALLELTRFAVGYPESRGHRTSRRYSAPDHSPVGSTPISGLAIAFASSRGIIKFAVFHPTNANNTVHWSYSVDTVCKAKVDQSFINNKIPKIPAVKATCAGLAVKRSSAYSFYERPFSTHIDILLHYMLA